MKHDRLRRQSQRHADPSVIHLPSQLPPHAPPGRGAETDGAIVLDDEIDLLAQKNIFEAEPRVIRQARRRGLRAEQKAARRAATERFLIGAPSMAEAASQLQEREPPIEWGVEAPLSPSEHEAAVAHLADLLVAERPLPVPVFDKEMEQRRAIEEIEATAVADEVLVETISATGPLIVDQTTEDAPPDTSVVCGPTRAAAISEAAPVETMAEAVARIIADAAAEEPIPVLAETVAGSDVKVVEVEMAEPAWLETAPETHADSMAAPLPRNRSLVAHKRHWLLRLLPRLSRRPAPAPEPALAQLQELRFELVTALRKLDQIIERTA